MIESIQLWSFRIYVEQLLFESEQLLNTLPWKKATQSCLECLFSFFHLFSEKEKSSHPYPKLIIQKQQKLAHNFINTTRSLRLLAFRCTEAFREQQQMLSTNTVRKILFAT